MEKQPIIIVGAGISGLVLARQLSKRFDITILEATPYAGGRILTLKPENFPKPVEAGAEFVHGNLKHTLLLAKEAGISYEATEGKMYRISGSAWVEEDAMVPGWDSLMKTMKSQQADSNFDDFLQTHFAEESHAELRQHARAFAEGFDLADPAKASTKALQKEWSKAEDINYRIQPGYGALVAYLEQQANAAGCHIIYNQVVKEVHWQKQSVTLRTATGENFSGSRIFITIPLGLLQQPGSRCGINFMPPLHAQMQASTQIGFGTAVKVMLLFKKTFWPADAGFIFSEEEIPTWWTQLPDPIPMLTGWVGGPKATTISGTGDAAILRKAIRSLANIFDTTIENLEVQLEGSHVANWSSNECALGAYSYNMPLSAAAKKLLNEPVEETIFFCGESLSLDANAGTVEAAIASAIETAGKV